MPRKLAGIRRHYNKWQTYIRIQGHYLSKSWPLDTPVPELRKWHQDQIALYETGPDHAAGFRADVATYLTRVAAMPTYAQRADHLSRWCHELGRDRPSLSITSTEIDIVLQGWLETLAPGTVRKRRTALRSFFAKMYPKALNPVKATTSPPEPKAETRGIPYDVIERILAAMPDRRSAKRGTLGDLSLGKIRARVLAYTGIPPGLLQQVQPYDLNLQKGSVRIIPRHKGAGVEARTLPLTAEGLAAFKAFHAANAYGTFPTPALNASFKRACRRVGLMTVRLYDLRHSFLTEVYRVTRDLATVGRLGLHAEGSRITARYARGAHEEVDLAAVKAFDQTLATARQEALKSAVPVQKRSKKLPRKVARFPQTASK